MLFLFFFFDYWFGWKYNKGEGNSVEGKGSKMVYFILFERRETILGEDGGGFVCSYFIRVDKRVWKK